MCTHANSRFTVEKVIENKHLAVGSGGGVNYITSQQTDRARIPGRHDTAGSQLANYTIKNFKPLL